MTSMFNLSGIGLANMDATLQGWAKLDTTVGETAIQSGVNLTAATYTDATAVQYLVDTYGWTINNAVDAGVQVGDNTLADTLNFSALTTDQTIHGLGGDDVITGGTGNDGIWGGSGNDTLTGGAGSDAFWITFEDAGDDTITDFDDTAGTGDSLNISQLLIGYVAGSEADFVSAAADVAGTGTTLTIDHDGTGALSSPVTVTLEGVAFTATVVDDLLASGNLVMA
jgi:Ca2+-binding RTX toxin-like protein